MQALFTPQRQVWRPRNSTFRSSPTTSRTCAPPATRSRRAAFQDLVYDHVRRVGAQASDQGTVLPVGVDIGGGVKTVGTPRLDDVRARCRPPVVISISPSRGEGFFKIQHDRRHLSAYTRDGTFSDGCNQGRVVNIARQSGAADHHRAARTRPASPSTRRARSPSRLPGSTTSDACIGQIGLTRFHQQDRPAMPIGEQSVHQDTPASGAAPGRHRQCGDGFGEPAPRATSNRPMSKWCPKFPT